MHLLYADDSGSVEDPNQQYYVLAGVSVFERQGFWISQQLDQIAARFNASDPNEVELHGSPMHGGRDEWRRHPVSTRITAISDALAALQHSHPSNCIFGIAVHKQAISPHDPIRYAFEQLCSRFDQSLMRLHRKGDTQRGLIVFDKSTYETTIQTLARDFRSVGHQWGVVRNLAEVPLFIDSRASRLVQLADLVAYSIFRKCERGDDRFFNIISGRFDQEGGVIHGYHHRHLAPK
jgi:hypothetical protein